MFYALSKEDLFELFEVRECNISSLNMYLSRYQ